MLITLLRHATAQDRNLPIHDYDRELTEKGIKQIKRLATFCNTNELFPTQLFASPLRRADQSAKLFQAALKSCPAVKNVEWLAINTPTANLIAALKQLASQDIDNIWLVGHEPNFSELMAELLNTDSESFNLKKASLTRIEVNFNLQATACLLWSIPCALLP